MKQPLWFLCFALLLGFPAQEASATSLDEKLTPYLQAGSVLVADDHQVLYARYADQLFIPASVLKLATALAALHVLGTAYQFKTEFFLTPHNDLVIRGFGDPQFVSEEMAQIASSLSQQPHFPNKLRHLYLDATSFDATTRIPGVENSLNPYDALNGALVANFNTIYVEITEAGTIRSAEKQTPLIPLAQQLAKGLTPGKHRINISHQEQYILPYLGGLFQAFLQQAGIPVSGTLQPRSVQPEDQLVYTFQNPRRLTQTIESMMLYSNNFIANQLFFTLGLQNLGAPAQLHQGRQVMRHFLTTELQMAADQFQVVEGSGISRKNRFSAHAILTLLKAFAPYRTLLAKHQGVRLKTGTLKGVYSMAGYFPDPERNLYFVIMLNQKRNYRDKILSLLLKESF